MPAEFASGFSVSAPGGARGRLSGRKSERADAGSQRLYARSVCDSQAMRRALSMLSLSGLLLGAAPLMPARAGNLGDAVEPSSPAQIQLAKDLKQAGAIFYGAWWCTHCFYQKNLFGTEGGRELPYIECASDEAGKERCQQAGVRAFPTWVMGEKRKEGVMTLEQLRAWAGL